MIVTITLEKMKFHAFHGVMEEEHTIGGEYIVDVSYAIDTNVVETDRLDNTTNYADIYNLIKKEMMQPSLLIEHVAGRILNVIKAEFPLICDLSVKVSKLNPPINGEMGSASVMIKA